MNCCPFLIFISNKGVSSYNEVVTGLCRWRMQHVFTNIVVALYLRELVYEMVRLIEEF